MGRRTSSGPKPWRQFEVRTTFLRVPAADWPAVKIGAKTEFRATGDAVTQLWNVRCPTPVVGYATRRAGHDSRLLVLEGTWQEPLGLIADSPESLAREGYESFAHWRRYYMARTRRRFEPLAMCQVYRVRPFRDDDAVPMGEVLLTKLYEEHLP